MKTAMQQAIALVKKYENRLIPMGVLSYNLELLFEKEKEQIIEAYDRGYKACDLDEALEINKTMFSGEGYYEQTYKPETI
jgi:hypothetical protein